MSRSELTVTSPATSPRLQWQRKSANQEAEKCIVYWDYANMPIPKNTYLSTIKTWLNDEICKALGSKISIEVRVYVLQSKLTSDLCNKFEQLNITQVHVSGNGSESVSKRMICDIALSLYELECDKKSGVIALISNDVDFSFLLNQIRVCQPITNSFLICLNPKQVINQHLLQSADAVIVFANSESTNQSSAMVGSATPRPMKICIKLTDLKCQHHSFWMNTSSENGMVNIVNTIYTKLINPPYPKKCLCLMFKNRELPHMTMTIGHAKIVNASQIFWFWKPTKMNEALNRGIDEQMITIYLQQIGSNERCKFMVRPQTKIKKIKARMKRMVAGMRNMKYVTLWLRNQQMTNKFCLQNYGVVTGDTISYDEFHYSHQDEAKSALLPFANHVVADNGNKSKSKSMSGLDWVDDLVDFSMADAPSKISVILSNVNTKQTFTFEVNPNAKIGKFKNQMRKESDSIMSMKSIKLTHKGLVMVNKNTWNEYGVIDGDIILFEEYSQNELDEYETKNDENGNPKRSKSIQFDDIDLFGVNDDVVSQLSRQLSDDTNDSEKPAIPMIGLHDLFQSHEDNEDVDEDDDFAIFGSSDDKEKEEASSMDDDAPPFLATYLM